jgi:hypothetical protein
MSYTLITKSDEEPYYELSLMNNKTCKIDINSFPKIKNIEIDNICDDFEPNWYVNNGYIMCSIPSTKLLGNISRFIYMHRYLLNQFNYDGKISVDHINQDPTDNRLSNLRLATQSTQNHNQTKKERKFIKLTGFDTEIQLPEYIEYVKEETIKSTRNGEECDSILPEHFRIVSKYLEFEKHSSKSSKISLKERLADALIKRYNLIINSNVNIENLYIDGYRFKNKNEFEKHTIEYINILCNIFIERILDNDDFLEKSKIKKNNLPKYVSYASAKAGRGSQLIYDRRNKETGERTEFTSSCSKFKSLDDKFIEIVDLMKKNNVDIIWNIKPDFVNQSNQIEIITNNLDFSKECLMDIKNSCQNKTHRLKPNPVDIIIINKLVNDIESINKSVISSIMGINYDRISQIINNELKLDTMSKISEDYINHTNSDFINEYNTIKSMIISEMTLRKDKKSKPENVKKQLPNAQDLLDLTSKLIITPSTTTTIPTSPPQMLNRHKNWKFDTDTIINMVKDKGVLTYQQISEKYTDVEGKPISISDVQNVCSNNKAYSLDEDDFININRSDISFEEYKSKRQTDVRLDMSHKTMKDKYDDITTDKYKQLCKTNSVSKRTCDSETMVDIFMDKYTILTSIKTSLKYKNKKGEVVSDALVKQIWSGSTALFLDDFINRTDITYEQYLTDIKKDKTEFSRPLEYKQKYEDILEGIKNGEIKSLNRTHIKTLKMIGKDDQFINQLKSQIK